MTREDILARILEILKEEFEIENPGLDDNLREVHNFDSIDAIELLENIEKLLKSSLTQEEKKQMMTVQTINQVLDYIEGLIKVRSK